jgi:hypothetical protein
MGDSAHGEYIDERGTTYMTLNLIFEIMSNKRAENMKKARDKWYSFIKDSPIDNMAPWNKLRVRFPHTPRNLSDY